jgi:hypothetical protein
MSVENREVSLLFLVKLGQIKPQIRDRAIKPRDAKGNRTRVLGKDLEDILILVLYGF